MRQTKQWWNKRRYCIRDVAYATVLVFIILAVTKPTIFQKETTIPTSSKSESSDVRESGFFFDDMRYLNGTEELEIGLRRFYSTTGVLPFVYFTDNINGDYNPEEYQVYQFADDMYHRLFNDESHLLLVACRGVNGWTFSYWQGYQTRERIPTDMMDFIISQIKANYTAGTMNNGEVFGEAFSSAFDQQGKAQLHYVTISLVFVVIFIVLYVSKRKLKNGTLFNNKLTGCVGLKE